MSLGRKQIAVLAAVILLLVAKGNSQCPQGLPLFGDRDPHNELPDKIQAILPTYTFTCSGQVIQWGACVQPRGNNERYDIYFQVWRSTGVDGCYTFVGSNFVDNGDPNIPRGCIVFDVPVDQRITVQAGDVMGFYSDHNRDYGGIELDTDVHIDVSYRSLSNPTMNDLENSPLCIGSNQDLSSSESGAPVLMAVVDNLQCLSSTPPFGDRDGVSALPDRIQAIIPAYSFNCRGEIVQWGVCVNPHNDNYDIYFHVWRPMGVSGCYSPVGSNSVINGTPGSVHNVRRCIVLDVPVNDQITVEPGDVLGLYSRFDDDDGGGVELDEGANYDVWYRTNPNVGSLDTNTLCIGTNGDLNNQVSSGAPTITAVIAADCGSLMNPANGTVALTTTTYDSMADYSCSNLNTLLVGDAVRTCQADGMWNGTAPTCVEVCDALTNPINGSIMFSNGRFVGSVATYSCDVGFEPAGSETRTCQSGSGWSGLQTSCVVDCGGLTNPAKGAVLVIQTTFGSTASYSCIASNYLLVGDITRMCQANGMWSGGAPTCEEVCDTLTNPTNGSITFSNERFVGSVATYSCDVGFEPFGSETRTCQSGSGWSGVQTSCERMCDRLDAPENGQVMLTTRIQGSVASYSCATGYNLIGNSSRTCQMTSEGLEWSDGEPVCQIVDCNSLTNPENGTVSLPGTTFGSIATYSCNGSNYTLERDGMRECQADGTWSGSAPSCDLLPHSGGSDSNNTAIIGGAVGGLLGGILLTIVLIVAVVLMVRGCYKKTSLQNYDYVGPPQFPLKSQVMITSFNVAYASTSEVQDSTSAIQTQANAAYASNLEMQT